MPSNVSMAAAEAIMIDLAKLSRLRQTFAALLHDLSATWPEQDVEYVREEVGHSVFGDALENLIAIGLRNGMGFNPDQVQQVQALAAIMAMEDSPFIGQLRRTMRGSS